MHQSFVHPLLGVKELVPCILVVTRPEFLNQVALLIRKPIEVLSVDDLFLEHLQQLQLAVVVVLVQIFLVFEVGRLLDKGKIGEVFDVGPHDLHHDFFGALVAELVVNEDRSYQALEDIAKHLQRTDLELREVQRTGHSFERLVEEPKLLESGIIIFEVHEDELMQVESQGNKAQSLVADCRLFQEGKRSLVIDVLLSHVVEVLNHQHIEERIAEELQPLIEGLLLLDLDDVVEGDLVEIFLCLGQQSREGTILVDAVLDVLEESRMGECLDEESSVSEGIPYLGLEVSVHLW